eukprot:TRINITY_DN14826_c0_g2_i1.p1 TRINITY_DN14826_c0_g2~~TRINITY_DN14826_c0_g2_i1.p1  ORF type:complete len:711 (-),score=131.78 TRINITY_DN14826_c0_g2_i1:100-2232(-)
MQSALTKEFPPTVAEWLTLLTSDTHLKRDGALRKLDNLLASIDPDNKSSEGTEVEKANTTVADILSRIEAILDGSEQLEGTYKEDGKTLKWEAKQGLFQACQHLLESAQVRGVVKESFARTVLSACKREILDSEVRVRTAVAAALHGLVQYQGVSVYNEMKDILLDNIRANFERSAQPEESEAAEQGNPDGSMSPRGHHRDGESFPSGPIIRERVPIGTVPGTAASAKNIPSNEGWKSLETSMRALERIMSALGNDFAPHVTDELLNLIASSLSHINRFVREIGYFTCAGLFGVTDPAAKEKISSCFAPKLADGLADNWSQVRYAASVATKSFLSTGDETYFPLLIPRMCLNRYYVAEGVRLYAQKTWRDIVGMRGLELVASLINEIVEYYVVASEADNHAVREAACRCIAELATKVDKKSVAPHVPVLLQTLINCFKDESWPVRDCACTATGSFVQSFPEESRTNLEELYELWIAHLSDNIWSVRENAAFALGQVMVAYGDEASERVLAVLREQLPLALTQEDDSKLHNGLSNTTTFGVAEKKARDNDPHLHTGQQTFSCGSLAPKLRRGGGCMDHGFVRPKQPWESTDGCVYLLRELAQYSPKLAAEFLPTLAQVASIRSFAHYHLMLETIFKQLPTIAKRIGNELVAPHLPLFIEPLFGVLERNENRLAMSAAGYAIFELRAQFGEAFTSLLSSEQTKIAETNQFVR